jgi:hypothetical protein
MSVDHCYRHTRTALTSDNIRRIVQVFEDAASVSVYRILTVPTASRASLLF